MLERHTSVYNSENKSKNGHAGMLYLIFLLLYNSANIILAYCTNTLTTATNSTHSI